MTSLKRKKKKKKNHTSKSLKYKVPKEKASAFHRTPERHCDWHSDGGDKNMNAKV